MFHDRVEAGRLLAKALLDAPAGQTLVLALDAAGAPVGRAIADALGAPLDILVLEALTPPRDPDVAIGWATAHGTVRLDGPRLRRLELPPGYLARETERRVERAALREWTLRGGAGLPEVGGRWVILATDGVLDALPIEVAAQELRGLPEPPARIVLATPAAWPDAAPLLPELVDAVVVLETPRAIATVGQDYHDFRPVGDLEARAWLRGRTEV